MVMVTDAEHVGEYRIHLKFSDGAEGIVDLRETVFGDSRALFVGLREIGAFERFRVAMDTVVWDNGLDLAPEYLRDLLSSQADDPASHDAG